MATMNATFTWALYETRIREFLGIATGEDDTLQDLLDSATRAGDNYTNNPFVDDSGVDLNPMPRAALAGVLAWMRAAYQLSVVQKPGLVNVKTGDLQESYFATQTADPGKLPLASAKQHWRVLRLNFNR